VSRSWSTAALVVAGNARSTLEMSSDAFDRFPTLVSEHTANGANGTSASVAHSRSDCDSREIEGTRNSTDPPLPASCSARRNEVNVLPVPQAMINLPRSLASNPAVTFSIAVSWWARNRFRSWSSRASGVSKVNCDQSISEFSRSDSPILRTGICWAWIASSAFAFHRSVVDTMIRSANPALPDAARNESTSGFAMVPAGS